jgi:predicted nucleic acid-binding protein
MIFVDTSAWYASVVPTDPNHAAATAWLAANRETLLTTDYIADETLTLLRMRQQTDRALALGKEFFEGDLAVFHLLSEDEIREAWHIFSRFHDKEWSFTDCTSKAVIERLSLAGAFAFDRHFHQFGSVVVVP